MIPWWKFVLRFLLSCLSFMVLVFGFLFAPMSLAWVLSAIVGISIFRLRDYVITPEDLKRRKMCKEKKGRFRQEAPLSRARQGENLSTDKSHPRAAPAESHDQCHEKNNQKNVEQNLCDSGRGSGHTEKPKKRGDQSHDEENQRPLQHRFLLQTIPA